MLFDDAMYCIKPVQEEIWFPFDDIIYILVNFFNC